MSHIQSDVNLRQNAGYDLYLKAYLTEVTTTSRLDLRSLVELNPGMLPYVKM